MNDKVVTIDLDALRASIYAEIEDRIKTDVYYDVYYGFFSDLPLYVLVEQFLKIYSEEMMSCEKLTEKGYALLIAMAIKVTKFVHGDFEV